MSVNLPFHKAWLEEEEHREVEDTLNSGWLTTGPKTQEFEEAFKDYIGCKHAVALNSCTAGLNLALALQNFADGDEVITTPMTFPATANAILLQRLKPIFADIEPGTLTIDPRKIAAKITPRTRAIIPVHFAGHPCDMTPIEELADQHKLVIIEDAAHALETGYKGQKINATAFSFYANKNITTGEGGMLVTNDDALAENLFQSTTFFTGDEKPGEKIDLLREVVYFNPEHIQGYVEISRAYDKTLNGKKAITNAIIAQRFFSDKKMMKELAESRESLNALYKKYKMRPEEFRNVITPRKTYH